MDATDAEVRAWAQKAEWRDADGEPVSGRGRVGADARDAYSAAHNGGGPSYPPGMDDGDFDTAEADEPDEADDPDMREARPRPVAPKVSARSAATSLRGRLRRGKRSGKPKAKARARVSTSDLIGSAWRIGAKLAPVLPLQRTLSLQSEIAGPLLDSQVKDTLIDPFLQVLARHYQAGEVAGALLGPNLGIGVATFHQIQCAKAGTEPSPVVLQACMEVTRYGVKAMMRLGGEAFAARLAAEQEEEEKYGASVDMILAWIMSPPADPATEEANAARAARVFAGQPEPEPEPAGM